VSARVGDGLPEALPEVVPDVTPPVGAAPDLLLDRVGWSALRYPAFQAFLLAMLMSTSANFIFFAALGWYVVEVTGSPAAVGLAFAAYGLPVLLFTAQAGAWTDRYGSKRMVLISIGGMGIASLAVAGVALLPAPPLWAIVLLAFLLGVAQTLGGPGVVAIVGDLVPPPAVSSSVALNFLHMSLARILGGLVGGLLLAFGPAVFAFAVTGILGTLPVLLLLRLPASPVHVTRHDRTSVFRSIREALAYGARFPTVGVLILLAILPGLVGLSYVFMLPVAADELGIGPQGLGTLLAASGIGGLIAGLSLERIQRRIGHGRAMYGGLLLASISLIGFGLAPGVLLASVALAVIGAAILTYAAANVTLIQAVSPRRLRGRLVSIFALFYWGLLPVGSALLGFIAEPTSAQFAVLVAGVALGVGTLVAIRIRPQVVTLAVSRDGVTVTGDLTGSGIGAAGAAA
jgi:MFS family permease